jgi:hypothetical protein
MRCDCCDAGLEDRETTAKLRESGTYTNMCIPCLKITGLYDKVVFRHDLEKLKEVDREVNSEADDLTEWEKMNMRAEDWDDS